EPEISWLMQRPQAGRATPDRLHLDPAAVQAGILAPFNRPPGATLHGALVLLRVEDAALARAWLASAPASSEAAAAGLDPVTSVALTFPGLVALGLPASQRQKFPREFIDGMEARAGILGDVRGNHPLAWTRPPRNWVNGAQAAPVGAPVDLATVHVLIQLRTVGRAGETGIGQLVLPRLQAAILALGFGTGLAVLAVQAGHSLPPRQGEPQPRNKFGYVDGVSQPVVAAATPAPQTWRDEVRPGELFLGYANDRGDGAPAADPLLDDGSFLVVRKLRMYPERLEQRVSSAVRPGLSADTVRAKLMGRHPNGRNLQGAAGNDFDYRQDATGSGCPLASHARRCNPREPRADGVMPPRLMRRGLSYGHESGHGSNDRDDVGLLFMAYNASIAEQFEVLQRWIAGGNSTGLSAAQDDPFLGVPEPGTPRIFRFEHAGAVQRVDLGPEPLVSLQWGLYAFVPSLAALKALPALCVPDGKAAPAPLPLPQSHAGWKAVLEDSASREVAWAQVRLAGGVLPTPYGLLVGGQAQVQTVLQDDGSHFSTGGYGDRMAASIGRGFLGQDDVGPACGHAQPSVERVNAAIEALSQAQAYDETLRITAQVLPTLMGHKKAATVDLERLAGLVLAGLCTAWFGAPDGTLIKNGARCDDPAAAPVCPGHLVGMSRYVFAPDPSVTVSGIAAPQGQSFTAAIRKLLHTPAMAAAPLTQAILRAQGDAPEQAQAELIAGIMLGFPATVLGHLLTLLKLNAQT
ncbi:MAG: Dyp-type peroxidase, partial [Microbacteriaceae bacterium]|nr:Dyp-type peroxidase [Burkholderiaceae bacterium]